jgi:hypothetical protein
MFYHAMFAHLFVVALDEHAINAIGTMSLKSGAILHKIRRLRQMFFNG